MKRIYLLLIIMICAVACNTPIESADDGSSAIESGGSTNNGSSHDSSDSDSTNDDDSETTSTSSGSSGNNDADEGADSEEASYEINLDGAEALLIQDSAISTFAIIDDGFPGIRNLSNGGHSTNFWKLDSLGEIRPAIERVSEDTNSYSGAMVTVNAERIDVSPTGELYVYLSDAIRIGDTLCKWIAVNPYTVSTTTNVSSCAEEDTGFDINRVVFDNFGNVYYSDTYDEIRLRDVADGTNVTLFKGEDIDFTIGDFVPAPDGSLFLLGVLSGTDHHLFRYYSEAIFGSSKIVAQCPEGFVSWDKQFMLDDDGNIYLHDGESPILCSGSSLSRSEFFKITFTSDFKSVYTTIPGDIYGYEMAKDSQGNIYAVGDVRYDNNWNTVTVLSDSSYVSIEMSLSESDLFQVKGDYMFAAGTDDDGYKVFLRKHLLGAEEEIDLLNGRDMLVQGFDVKENGDVYFGALDYDTVQRGLYLYHGNTGTIDKVLGIPNDLQTILYLP